MSGAAAAGGVSAGRMSARRAALVGGVTVVAFAAAFGIGSMSKTSTTATPAGQLAPVSALHGQSSVQISAPGAAGSIPTLAQVAKPKPAHKPAATATASTPTQSSASSTSNQTVAQQPVQQTVAQQPVSHPVTPVTPVTPVSHPTQPTQPVVVVHGG